MKNIIFKALFGLTLGAGLLSMASPVYAIDTWHIDTERAGVDHTAYNIDDPAIGQDHVMMWDITSGYQSWLNPARFQSEFLDVYYNYVHATTLSAATTSLTSTINNLQTNLQNQINTLNINGGSFNVAAFMINQASTTPLIATSTFNGFMSGAMVNKLAVLSTSTATQSINGLMSSADKTKLDGLYLVSTSTPTVNSSNRSLNTCFQVSGTRDAFVSYSIDIDSTLTLGGGSVGQAALTTYTDSGCTTNSVVVQKAKAGLTGTLVVGVTLNNPATVTLGGIITRNLYAKLVTTNASGTPTYTMNTTQEVTGTLVQ